MELIGHAELLAALKPLKSEALILKSPKTAKTAIENQSALTPLLGATRVDAKRVKVIEASDIASLEQALYGTRMPALKHEEAVRLAAPRGRQTGHSCVSWARWRVTPQSPSSPVIPTA